MIIPLSAPACAIRHPLPAELVHDLRTPLAHIIGYSEMLMEQAREAGHEDYLPDLQKVNAAGLRLLALFDASVQSVRPPGPPAGEAPETARTSRA